MSQVILELNDRDDLALLLSFVRRLNINVVSVRSGNGRSEASPKSDDRIEMMKKAGTDPLFLADVAEIESDFEHADSELN